jgi:hypothetical protein
MEPRPGCLMTSRRCSNASAIRGKLGLLYPVSFTLFFCFFSPLLLLPLSEGGITHKNEEKGFGHGLTYLRFDGAPAPLRDCFHIALITICVDLQGICLHQKLHFHIITNAVRIQRSTWGDAPSWVDGMPPWLVRKLGTTISSFEYLPKAYLNGNLAQVRHV